MSVVAVVALDARDSDSNRYQSLQLVATVLGQADSSVAVSRGQYLSSGL